MEFHRDVLRSVMNLSVDRAINSRLTESKYGGSGDQEEPEDLYMEINLDWIGFYHTELDNGYGRDRWKGVISRQHWHFHNVLMLRRQIVICMENWKKLV